jgi:hypothetical protein
MSDSESRDVEADEQLFIPLFQVILRVKVTIILPIE